MYELSATINPADGDRLLDELVLLFEAHGKDCTSGIVGNIVLGYVDEDMLSKVTATIHRDLPHVDVQIASEDEALALA